MEQKIQALQDLQKRMYGYGYAMGMIYLDGATVAPKDTAEGRGEALAVLSAASYDLINNEQSVALLYDLKANMEELDSITARQVQELIKEYERTSKIPKEAYVAYQKLLNHAEHIWHIAKEENDFAMFAPYLEKIVEENKRIAAYYDSDKDPYDVLLDLYEEGLTQQKADVFFAEVKKVVVPLLEKLSKKKQLEDSFIYGDFPVEKQKQISKKLMEFLCMDKAHCAIAETEHPFTIEFNPKDVRITTNYNEKQITSSVYSVIHEAGHALYELGIDGSLSYTCLSGGVSMGIHESQSRLFENMVGRSKAFMPHLLGYVQKAFPVEFAEVTPEMLYKAVNKCEPSLIRIEADELTYSLHIMVRYELEKQLIHGRLQVRDLPEAWNKLMKEYLGVDVPDDTRGVLQDTHWSGGSIGYFPSYAIGSAYAAQIMAHMNRDLAVESLIAEGNLKPIIAWLTERIYQYGKIYTPEELLYKCCKEPFDPSYYTKYLEEKFTELYDL